MNDEQPPSKNHRGFFSQLISTFSKGSSKKDLREYLQDARDNHVIDKEEAAMLDGVLAVSEQRVRDVMLPKSKMVHVSHDMSFDETINLVIESGHSRFPVEEDDEIIGILLAKDLLTFLNKDADTFRVSDIMRPVYFIPESKPLDDMFKEFRKRRLHMAVVTNEYSEVAGLITVEDVIEEIVGEIDDEHDREEIDDIRKISDTHYLVNAVTEVEEFNTMFGTELDDDAHDTIGGCVLSHLGYVPTTGETTSFSGLDFTIKRANDRRILSLIVSHSKP